MYNFDCIKLKIINLILASIICITKSSTNNPIDTVTLDETIRKCSYLKTRLLKKRHRQNGGCMSTIVNLSNVQMKRNRLSCLSDTARKHSCNLANTYTTFNLSNINLNSILHYNFELLILHVAIIIIYAFALISFFSLMIINIYIFIRKSLNIDIKRNYLTQLIKNSDRSHKVSYYATLIILSALINLNVNRSGLSELRLGETTNTLVRTLNDEGTSCFLFILYLTIVLIIPFFDRRLLFRAELNCDTDSKYSMKDAKQKKLERERRKPEQIVLDLEKEISCIIEKINDSTSKDCVVKRLQCKLSKKESELRNMKGKVSNSQMTPKIPQILLQPKSSTQASAGEAVEERMTRQIDDEVTNKNDNRNENSTTENQSAKKQKLMHENSTSTSSTGTNTTVREEISSAAELTNYKIKPRPSFIKTGFSKTEYELSEHVAIEQFNDDDKIIPIEEAEHVSEDMEGDPLSTDEWYDITLPSFGDGVPRKCTRLDNCKERSRDPKEYMMLERYAAEEYMGALRVEYTKTIKIINKINWKNWSRHDNETAILNLKTYMTKHIKTRQGEGRMNRYNEELEIKYPRDKFGYELLIKGAGIKNFSKDMTCRLTEIAKYAMVNANGIDELSTVNADDSDEVAIYLKTFSWTVYKTIKNKLKINNKAFGSGVTAEPLPTHLEVKVMGFEVDRDITKNQMLVKKLNEAGLFDVKRITNVKGEPIPQLRARVESLARYIKLIKEKKIKVDPKQYCVEPVIRYANPCGKCGALNHGPKNCIATPLCLKCGDVDHQKRPCVNTLRCINCNGCHATNSESCALIRSKIYNDNKYILSLLVGEGIFKTNDDILRSNAHTMFDLSNIKSYIDEKIANLNGNVEVKLNTISDDQSRINSRMGKLENRTDLIERDMVECRKEIGECKSEISECRSEISECKSEISECKSEIGKCRGDVSACKQAISSLGDKVEAGNSSLKQSLTAQNNLILEQLSRILMVGALPVSPCTPILLNNPTSGVPRNGSTVNDSVPSPL